MIIGIILFLAVAVFGFVILKRLRRLRAEAKWREDVTKLFGPTVARKIFNGKIWMGMTAQQLELSWGLPMDKERTVTKRTAKEIWKYNQSGVNRFQDRISLEHDKVVGWKGQNVGKAEVDDEEDGDWMAKRPWFEVLNVSPVAYLEDVKTAMRTLLNTYDTDRLRPVEGSHAQFYKLADDRLKEITVAYEEAKKVCKPHPRSTKADSNIFAELIVNNQESNDLESFLLQARTHGEPLGHLLLIDPSPCPQNTIARAIALWLGVNYTESQATRLTTVGDLAAWLTNLANRDILLIDDIHRFTSDVEELLVPAMQTFQLDLTLGEEQAARDVKVDLDRFTLIGVIPTEKHISPRLLDAFRFRVHISGQNGQGRR